MRRWLKFVFPTLLIMVGVVSAAVYGVLIYFADDRVKLGEEWGGFVAVALIVSVIGALSIYVFSNEEDRKLPVLPVWAAILLFALAIASGFASMYTDHALYLAPVFAVAAAIFVGLFFLRIITHWSSERKLPGRLGASSILWGMTVSPAVAGITQLISAALIVGGIAGGIYLQDPDLARSSELRGIFDALGDSTADDLPDIYGTPTIALALFTLLAIVAPFTEELIKAIGPMITLGRRKTFSDGDVLIAAVGSGVGFAALEALGYSLLDFDGWAMIMAIRAPVVAIHVAGTILVVRGWQLQRERGGLQLFWHYLIAVAIHGAWNGLFVATIVVATRMDTTSANPDSLAAVLMLAIFAGLGLVLLAAIAVIVTAVRRVAQSERRRSESTDARDEWLTTPRDQQQATSNSTAL